MLMTFENAILSSFASKKYKNGNNPILNIRKLVKEEQT